MLCPSCGLENPRGGHIGAPAAQERSPRTYTPEHLGERILGFPDPVERLLVE